MPLWKSRSPAEKFEHTAAGDESKTGCAETCERNSSLYPCHSTPRSQSSVPKQNFSTCDFSHWGEANVWLTVFFQLCCQTSPLLSCLIQKSAAWLGWVKPGEIIAMALEGIRGMQTPSRSPATSYWGCLGLHTPLLVFRHPERFTCPPPHTPPCDWLPILCPRGQWVQIFADSYWEGIKSRPLRDYGKVQNENSVMWI